MTKKKHCVTVPLIDPPVKWCRAENATPHFDYCDARVGEEHVEGAEIIGWDVARGCYLTQYFGSDGPNAYEPSLGEKDGRLVWTMRSRSDRFTGRFSDNGDTIEGHWSGSTNTRTGCRGWTSRSPGRDRSRSSAGRSRMAE